MADGVGADIVLLGDDRKIETQWNDYITHSKVIDSQTTDATGATICTSKTYSNSKFSTQKVVSAFGITQPANAKDYMVLGLDSFEQKDYTLDEVFTAYDIANKQFKEPLGTIVESFRKEVSSALPKFGLDDGPAKKNGMWIAPTQQDSLTVSTALWFKLKPKGTIELLDSLANTLQDSFGLDVDVSDLKIAVDALSVPRLRLKNKTFITKGPDDEFSFESVFELTIQLPIKGFLVNFTTRTNGQLEFCVLDDPESPGGGNIFTKLSRLLSDSPSEDAGNPAKAPEGNDEDGGVFKNPQLWKISLQTSTPVSGKRKFFWKIGFTIEMQLLGQTPIIGLMYDSQSGTFTGALLFQGTLLEDRLSPDFDDLADLPQSVLSKLPEQFNLAGSDEFSKLPNAVPTMVTEAVITFKKASGKTPSTLSFSATLEGNKPKPEQSANTVPFPFQWTSVTLDLIREKNNLSMELFSTFQLNPKSDRFRTALMSLNFVYSQGDKTWSLAGHAEDLQLGAIVEFFDQGMSDQVADILGKLSVKTLDVSYTYSKDVASSFIFVGLVEIGGLQLKLFYQYATAAQAKAKTTAADQRLPKELEGKSYKLEPLTVPGKADTDTFWQLDAFLDTSDPNATIGSIMDSFVDDASDSLPKFVKDIEVHSPDPETHLISLHATKTTVKNVERAIFALGVALNTIEFTFVQISKTIPGTPKKTETKRLLRLSVGRLPFIDGIPVVNELPQPYQELQYMWSPLGGLSRDEVATLNPLLQKEGQDNKLYFKPTTKAALDPKADKDPIVLVEGHHFIVVNNNEAVLDHVFSPSTNKTSGQSSGKKIRAFSPLGGIGDDSSKDGAVTEAAPTKGAMQKTTQFLNISGISVQYKKGSLWLVLDATLTLGPLQFSLIGFGIGVEIDSIKLNDLGKIKVSFQLRGMAIAFDKPPILIAGVFEHDEVKIGNQNIESYRGGVAVTIPPYAFIAVGEYAEITFDTGGGYKSFFIYGRLDGPIIDLQFAIIKGVRIGFGYNSMIRTPSVQELYEFPLINDNAADGSGTHPMAMLNNMRKGDNPWIQTKEDSYWFALGFTISSFNIINATAVALVSFRDGGPIFSIYADLIVANPPNAPTQWAHIIYVEILMMAELNFVEDCFKVQAALAPTSFIYVPMARLHGGFALYSFFGKSPHAGDWVFTAGGYHRKFAVPAHYPRPDRLGLDFSIGIISIRGEGYFAITPKAVMAGAMIRCELSLGPVYAWLDAAFDAMVQFDPMHYWVSMHVDVGVECDIPLLFVTIHIRIHIGAQLEIEGPDFGGTAYVDFWFFSFSFEFGAKPQPPNPLDLQSFYELCQKAGPPDTSSERTSATDDLVVQLKFSLEDGAFPMPSEDTKDNKPDDTGAGSKWFVKGGSFQFRVSSVFAATEAYVETPQSGKNNKLIPEQDVNLLDAVDLGSSSPKTLSSMPMGTTNNITSKLYVGIRTHGGVVTDGFQPSSVIKAMPQAMWSDPQHPPDRLSSEKGTMDLPMAITFKAPPPVLAKAKIPMFKAENMAKSSAGINKLPPTEDVQSVFLPEDLDHSPAGWGAMKDMWKTKAEGNLDIAAAMVANCMSALKWDKPDPAVKAKAEAAGLEPWKLETGFSKRLVAGTGGVDSDVVDGLENYYMELPRVVAV